MGEMLGFDNVNNAFGFVLMFYGLASFIGIPLAGMLLQSPDDLTFEFVQYMTCLLIEMCRSFVWNVW